MATSLLAEAKRLLESDPENALRWTKNRVLKHQITEGQVLAWPIWSESQKAALAELLSTERQKQAAKNQKKDQQARRPRIYADACHQDGLTGLAVVGDGWQVSEEGVAETNNEAECLAVLMACEEAKKRGIASPSILSDSRLVVSWTNGHYAQRPPTAQRYIPRIRQALKEIGGSLQWISGEENLADKPSRQVIGVWFDGTPLEKVMAWPMEKLRREDFAAVKSGRDEFSAMRKAKLIEAVSTQDYERICQSLDKEKYQLSALRWMLRGLSVDKAIRKVEVDREIGHEIAERREAAMMAEWEDDD